MTLNGMSSDSHNGVNSLDLILLGFVYDKIFCPIAELHFSNFFQTYLLKLAEMVLNC